jgi:uncharacterized protein (TIGR02646 family)
MIHVNRNRVPRPKYLDGQEVLLAYEKAATFFSKSGKIRAQAYYSVDRAYDAAPVLTALFELFGRKCAFCESPASEVKARSSSSRASRKPAEVEVRPGHFRPPDGAAELDGRVSLEHYWWLTYEWENLYPICKDCTRAKGPRFPMALHGKRVSPRTAYTQVIELEHPLLLDPCHDDPSKYLIFSKDGRVSSETVSGRTTIEVFALNRHALVMARAKAMRENKDVEVDPKHPFAAARRQVVLGSGLRLHKPSAAKQIKAAFEVYESGLEAFGLESAAAPRQEYFIKSRMIERIELENFRLFRKLALGLSSASEAAPWLMLLGENGLGKSTLLQAVALALMGDRLRARFRFEPRSFLRHGTTRGTVRIFLTGVREPVELIITPRGFRASAPPKALLLAYGATRLFGQKRAKSRGAAGRHARVQNLFDPFAMLSNPTTFFRGLPDSRRDAAARAAKSLLNLADDVRIVRASGDRMQIVKKGGRESFDDLSDGYRSMLALASDIMAVMFDQWEDMKTAEGIVLLDELENHLHPTWKMRVVSSLRSVFPRVQFITTTHDPLCLRGLQNGEVAVLQRADDGSVFARVDDLPAVAGLRVDQLLTSEHFGLASTTDPATEELFRQYYALIAKPKLSVSEKDERERLKQQPGAGDHPRRDTPRPARSRGDR